MARKATIGDVARLAGVSMATADRVLNGRGGVAPDKERAVLSAARRAKLDRALARSYARRLRVAVLIQGSVNPFHGALAQAFVSEGRAAGEMNIQFLVHHLDPNRADRTAAMVVALAENHDGLIVTSPADPDVAAALRRVSATIPVVTLATDIPQSGRQAYVGPDDQSAGRVAGDLIGRFMGRAGGEVMIVVGLLTIAGHRERELGFRAVLAEHHPACRVVSVVESGEDPERAGLLVAATLRDRPGLGGIYHASAGAGPVVQALRAADRNDVFVITHELTEDRRILLKSRALHAVIDQDPAAEVHVAIETIARLLGRSEGEAAKTWIPLRIFTPENA